MLKQFKNKWIRALTVALAGVVMSIGSANADLLVPTLYGIDEDQGEIFSIGDYNDVAGTLTNFGQLMWDDNGDIKSIGAHIEGFTLDAFGMAYMSLNKDFAGLNEAVFLKFDINNLSTTSPNIATVVGEFGVQFDSSGDNITGLGFNPLDGNLYALMRDNSSSDGDRLMIFDPYTGAFVADRGIMAGLGEMVTQGEDLVFDQLGNLYVTDDKDDHLYRVDSSTGDIVEIVDNDEEDGLYGRHSLRIEGLAWDPINNKLIFTEDSRNMLGVLSLEDGNNTTLQKKLHELGLSDVEGMAFVPSGNPSLIPEPAAAMVFAIALGAFVRRRPGAKARS